MKAESVATSESLDASTVVVTSADTVTMPVETGVEATEKRKSSWMKNLGSGMRTLRLRKSGSEKKNEGYLNNLAGSGGANTDSPEQDTQHPAPHPPLPPIPTEPPPPAGSSPLSPMPVKTLSKGKKNKSADSSSSLKNHTSRLSLREHVSKSKGKTLAAVVGASGGSDDAVLREGAGGAKSSNAPATAQAVDKADPARFIGDGLSFKAKLIGILEVSGPRGDRICQEALSELKMAVKAAGEHKQKVTIHVALDGLRVRDEKTSDCLYHHQVHKISFIAQDLTDSRAFGYIFGSPDTGHRFFGIKTEKSASQVVMSMRDLFQVVFDLKKKEIERAKQQLEVQQKFLATRAAETANRSCQKSGIAETYIDGACSLGGSPSISAAGGVPAEADLLNLEVELTSLQEGLDNIHSTLIDTATSHGSFHHGSTASISSDPMNPGSATVNKYNSFVTQLNSGSAGTTVAVSDPFGDSFDPFDSSKVIQAQTVVSPLVTDPFANVDPFAGTNFEPTEFMSSDPFAYETPLGSCAFAFPDSTKAINRQVSITSNSSDMSSGKASLNVDLGPSRAPVVMQSPMNKFESAGFTPATVTNWTASFEDSFGSTNGEDKGSAGNGFGNLFRDLDPLGTGGVKPFVDRKDFFQDLKNPPRKALSELTIAATSTTTTLRPEPHSSSPLPNSFSTNFTALNESSSAEQTGKLNKGDVHLRTSSIRAQQLPGDTPPSYSPPPPPIPSSDSPSVYFVSAPPKNTKKSPQLLRNMTIATSSQATTIPSPKTLLKSNFRPEKPELLVSTGTEEIPNITPPPRPPHTTGAHGIVKVNKVSNTALPRPHSGEGKRPLTSTITSGQPPEPPPRPLPSNPTEPVLPPPPLPPKKQNLGPMLSNTLTRVHHNTVLKAKSNGDPTAGWNDLPLPLPLRKGGNTQMSSQQLPRYAYPAQPSPTMTPPPKALRQESVSSFDDTDSVSSASHLAAQGMSMEAALHQVASLSLSQLAGRLQTDVEKLSTCTIQQLAIKLTLMNMKDPTPDRHSFGSMKTFPKSVTTFESNFADEDNFSTASAPAVQFPVKHDAATVPPQYDRYAVFRELAESDVGSFSICDSQENFPANDVEGPPQSRTLASRESSSEKTLQADLDPNGLSTMDDVTDANFSAEEDGEEKSVLLDEVVDLNLKGEWATFESNFDEFVPLTSAFSKSGESPWDSDVERNKFGTTDIATEEVQKVKSPKLNQRPNESSQFDFKLFEKPTPVSADPAGRQNSRHENQPFQRQSSGSSKHSEKSLGQRPTSSHNITTSDYSDSGKEKGSRRKAPWKEDHGRTPSSRRNSGGGRRYSREESDEGSSRRKWRKQYYYDDEEETGSATASPVERRTPRRRHDDEEYYSNTSGRRGHGHRHHSGKHYSQSLHRRDGRSRPAETEKYSNHESDFDSYEDERRRGGGGSSGRYSRERDYHYNSRPPSSGGSGSGGRHSRKPPRYRDTSREYYHHNRDHRDRSHRHSGPYHHRNGDGDYDGRELSEEDGGRRRIRPRRSRGAEHREQGRHRDQAYYYDSGSWDSETPPSGPDREGGVDDDRSDMRRGSRLRRSDLDRPHDRDRDRERPSSSSYHGDRLENTRKPSRYQSDLSLNAKSKLTVTEFGFETDHFSVPSHTYTTIERSSQEPPRPMHEPQVHSNKHNPNCPPANTNPSVVTDHGKQLPPESPSPFEDNFITENTIFFPADFPSTEKADEPVTKIVNNVTTNNRTFVEENEPPDSNSSESVENDSSPDIIAASDDNKLKFTQSTNPVLRKPIISDTIHEVPDSEMKKSDSFNIFDCDKDPFADDEFFT